MVSLVATAFETKFLVASAHTTILIRRPTRPYPPVACGMPFIPRVCAGLHCFG
jgi:hypothetical protein